MNHTTRLAVIGGDSRQIHMGARLRDHGYSVCFSAFELAPLPCDLCNFSLDEAIEKSNVFILPLPVSRDEKTLNASFAKQTVSLQSVLQSIPQHSFVFCGMPPAFFAKTLEAHDSQVVDYFRNEELTLQNALLTAEGIIGILTEQLPFTICNLRCAVTGYGRVAKYTARALQNLGAQVTVFARSRQAQTLAECDFIKAAPLTQLQEKIQNFTCVINTVPQKIIDEEIIRRSSPDCVFIEVASAPFGIDTRAIATSNKKLIKAVSLPGKTAPKTAGEIIADTIHYHLTEGFS